MSACGKSQAVKDTEAAIAAIGEVTVESEAAIKWAEKLYGILSDKEKAKVENRMLLADAQEAYEQAVADYEKEQKSQRIETVKAVYTALKQAYETVDQHGSDLYEAWRLGIYDKEEFQGSNLNGAMKHLQSELFVSYEDLLSGAAYTLNEKVFGGKWDTITEESKKKNKEAVATGTLFLFCADSIPAACVNTVAGAYLLNGSVEAVQTALELYTEEAELLKQGNDMKKEIEYLEKLYIGIAAYLDFCQSPTGSFNQCAETLTGFRTAVRDSIAYLDAALGTQ